METLQSIFKTSGQEFIDNLMNCSVTVYEKVNTSIFSVSKINDNEFVYYKGNGKKDGHKINLVDEISSTFYKRGIEHIENCSQIKKDKIIHENLIYATDKAMNEFQSDTLTEINKLY